MCGAILFLTQNNLGLRLTDAGTRSLCCRYSLGRLSACVGSGPGVNFGAPLGRGRLVDPRYPLSCAPLWWIPRVSRKLC